MSFAAKGEKKGNGQNQDKQTPHTVLQKLSPKPCTTPLKERKVLECFTWSFNAFNLLEAGWVFYGPENGYNFPLSPVF